MSNDDERDFDEEAANEAAMAAEREGELGDYVIEPPGRHMPPQPPQYQDRGLPQNWDNPRYEYQVPKRDDADLVADAMKALEDRVLATVPADQRDNVRDWISELLDLAPGEAMGLEATHDLARRVLAKSDAEVNAGAKFYAWHAGTDEDDTEGLPAIGIGGDEHGDGAILVYVYRQDGTLVISPHFDTAEGGPWAAYGPDGAIPVLVKGGDGRPVYVANADTPDLSDPLIRSAFDSLDWLARADAPDDRDHEDVAEAGWACAGALRDFLAITGHPYSPESRPEGGSAAEGGSGDQGGSDVQGGSGDA